MNIKPTDSPADLIFHLSEWSHCDDTARVSLHHCVRLALWRVTTKKELHQPDHQRAAGSLWRRLPLRYRLPSAFLPILLIALICMTFPSKDEAAEANPTTRSNTVEFFAGQHTGTTGANQNTQVNFTAQTLTLAETTVAIQNAYVEISGQIGATTATTYASSHIYFGACTPACSPTTSSYLATGSLGANTGDSQYIRLRANVTADAALAAYTGAGSARSFQVGYCFATGASCSGTTAANIFAMNAKLVLTYNYAANSTNRTSTVNYPLESSAGVGSKTASQAVCTMDSTCPKFSYNANIPELTTQYSQQFHVQTAMETTSTDIDVTGQVDGSASGTATRVKGNLTNQGGWLDYQFNGLAGYANNTAQQLEVRVAGADNIAYALGGENSVTYSYAANAATKTKTVSYPVGELITTSGSTTKSSLTGATVYMPESGVTIRKAWFRVHGGSEAGVAGSLKLSTKVGANAETSQTTYNIFNDNGDSIDGYLTHLIPSADYTALGAATSFTGVSTQIAAQWNATGAGGAVSAELMVTYAYTGEASAYQTTERVFAGQQTAAAATTYSTSTGAFKPYIAEAGAFDTVTIRGAHSLANAKNAGTTDFEQIGSNVTTSTCTPSLTSTTWPSVFGSRLMLWKNVTGTIANNNTQTYTFCGATTEASVFSGVLTVTYQVDIFINNPPYDPSSLLQTKTDTTTISTGSTTNETSVRFRASAADDDDPDTLRLCVEVKDVGTAFDGIGEVCGTGTPYAGTPVNPTVTVTSLANGSYHWRGRIKDQGDEYSNWVSYGGNSDTVTAATDFTVSVPPKRTNTVEFFAGQHTGTTGANQNAKIDFAAQTFQLAETGADIIDAYVEVSAQIGANTATTYASSYIYFDACTPACTPTTAAFTSTGSLGTNSGDSQYIRYRADVTAETEIAAYTGGGSNRSYAVGYCFATGGTCSGTTAANIFAASAKLVITYTAEATSTNQTNTVLYPLESVAGTTGSKTTSQAACTMNSTCPLLSYNADIPEISSQLSQQFHFSTTLDQSTTNDIDITPQVDGSASGSAVHSEAALTNNGGWSDYRFSGLAGYANNTAQQLEVGVTGTSAAAYNIGGENIVTYTRAASAGTKTKTVSYPVGEVITANASGTKSALTGPTVYLPEAGVAIEKAWFRVHGSPSGSGSNTLSITSKVGTNSETGQTGYAVIGDSEDSQDGYLVHLIPSGDFTQLQGATGSSGKAVQMTAQWTAGSGGAVSAELMITYSYTSDTSAYQTTQRLFAGQQTAAPATTYTTATGAIDVAVPEITGTVTVRGASVLTNAKNTGTTATEAIGSNLTTSTCTPSTSSTAMTSVELPRIMSWKAISGIVTNNDATTYTACYITTQSSVFSGVLTVTHQWQSANTAPNAPTSLNQERTDNSNTLAPTGLWTNTTGITFSAQATDPNNPDTLELCVEARAIGTGFTTDLGCGTPVAYNGSATLFFSATLADAYQYHWQARVRDAGGLYSSYVSFGGNAEAAADFGIDTTAPSTATVYDGTSAGVDSTYNTGALSSLSANWGTFTANVSGLDKYQYSIGTTAGGTTVRTWTDNSTTASVTATGLTLRTGQMYYFNVRAVDNAGNTSSVVSSNGQFVAPTLTFSASTSTVTFARLNASNSYTDTETLGLTTSTNGYNGYQLRARLQATMAGPSTISAFNGAASIAAPDAWLVGDRGFGYTVDDTLVNGTNIWQPSTCVGGNAKTGAGCYAPFVTAGSGDIIADHPGTITGTPISNETFTMTLKVHVNSSQAAGTYAGTLILSAVASY